MIYHFDQILLNIKERMKKNGRVASATVAQETKKINIHELNPIVFNLRVFPRVVEEDEEEEEPFQKKSMKKPKNDVVTPTSTVPLDIMRECMHRIQETYPADTHCFWDRHPVDREQATPLLTGYDIATHTFTGMGYFCSPACAMAYLFDRGDLMDDERWRSRALMINVYGAAAKTYAPPWETLRMFGGALAIEQFRDMSRQHPDHQVVKSMPPVRWSMPYLDVQQMRTPASTVAPTFMQDGAFFASTSKPAQWSAFSSPGFGRS
jgi:hypothetical protein